MGEGKSLENPLDRPTGDTRAFRAIYEELRRLAAHKMANELPGQTLQATALVHEAWLRLGGDAQPAWQNRSHFFAAASEAMRRILVERARRRARSKRGAGAPHIEFKDEEIGHWDPMDDRILRVNEALESFAQVDARKSELVKLRYFGGLTFEEAAEALEIGVSTAKEWWTYARAWLSAAMRETTDK